ncbi:MAG: ABC transporter permease [Candidatus Aminicenantes bacterium]|nr:ABC transporter permease [Candidatus Aminicenantes bacterium]
MPTKTKTGEPAAGRAAASGEKRERISSRTLGLIISTAILFGILALRSQSFLSGYTMFVVSRQMAFYVLIALSQASCLVVGQMSLAVGAIGSITTVVLGLGLDTWGLPAVAAVALALGVGVLAGAVNGMIITRLRIDSFIVTLSMMFIFMGLRSGISGGSPYRVPETFSFIGQKSLLGMPYVFLLVVALLGVIGFMYRDTVFGRRMLATGGNPAAARLSGINTDAMVVRAHILSGAFAALAAILWASKLGSAAPETGDDWLIISFAVAIIGGTGLTGGVISALGIFMGSATFMLIKHGLIEVKANPYYANSFLGLMILLAIVIDRAREIYSGRQRTR